MASLGLEDLIQRLADRHGVDLDALKIHGTEPEDFCGCPKPEGCYGQYGWHFRPQAGVFGGVVAYERCSRYREAVRRAETEDAAIRDLLTRLGVPGEYLGMRFETWEPARGGGPVPAELRAWVLEPRGIFTISGPAGTGKTHLAVAALAELVRGDRDLAWMSVRHVLARIKRDGDWSRAGRILDRLQYADVTVLDDLGAERGTDYDLSTIGDVVDYRHQQGFPMIVTTNFSYEELAARDGRIASRLWSGVVVERTGRDRRLG